MKKWKKNYSDIHMYTLTYDNIIYIYIYIYILYEMSLIMINSWCRSHIEKYEG